MIEQRIIPQRLAYRHTRHSAKILVENHCVGMKASRQLEGAPTTLHSDHGVPGGLEHALQRATEPFAIADDQDERCEFDVFTSHRRRWQGWGKRDRRNADKPGGYEREQML